MDVLDSILNDMDKPPIMPHEQREKIRKVQEAQKKEQEALKKQLKDFRAHVESEISKFVQDEAQERYTFDPMDHCFRTVIHEVAEVASLPAYSLGEEHVDRHVLVCKPNSTPCEDELITLRRGEEWNAEKAKELAEKRAQEKKEAEEMKKRPKSFVPNFNYKQKYEHIIGKEAAKDAARRTETNKQYGFVPSENKKDVRSIEQTLADIQSKKRQKVSHEPASPK